MNNETSTYYAQLGFKFNTKYPVQSRTGLYIGMLRPFLFDKFGDQPHLSHHERRYMRLYEFESIENWKSVITEPEAEAVLAGKTLVSVVK